MKTQYAQQTQKNTKKRKQTKITQKYISSKKIKQKKDSNI